jgi:hypothetical protein
VALVHIGTGGLAWEVRIARHIGAYSLALSIILTGSFPIDLHLPILPRLTVAQPAAAALASNTKSLVPWEFTSNPMQPPFIAEAGKVLLVGWINQLDVTVYTPLNMILFISSRTPKENFYSGARGCSFNDIALVHPNVFPHTEHFVMSLLLLLAVLLPDAAQIQTALLPSDSWNNEASVSIFS